MQESCRKTELFLEGWRHVEESTQPSYMFPYVPHVLVSSYSKAVSHTAQPCTMCPVSDVMCQRTHEPRWASFQWVIGVSQLLPKWSMETTPAAVTMNL